MRYVAAVVDTNVVVAGLLTSDPNSPTAKVLDGMCRGAFPFLLSAALLAEYREVLLRTKIRSLHGLNEREIDSLLTVLAANGIVREPETRPGAPDINDEHVWSLIQSREGCVLVTGDQALIETPAPRSAVLSPRQFIRSLSQ
ncbi:MAG TPA: putative toxin-antitoxin system toxin component, PIN family [Casimicrobiaceae bacterium]|nr:putative toxin-antitoxin system toxin component, PIN family [Casimicrobiaceae bacterium]